MLASLLVPAVGCALEAGLLLRGTRARLLSKHPFFYVYICGSLIGTIVAVAVMIKSPQLFERSYWAIQLLTLILGYGILLEILNNVLGPYPGAEKFARSSGLAAFILAFCFAFIAPLFFPNHSGRAVVEFERNLRFVQSVFIFGLVAVIAYYGIPMGRNMKGMMVGYGLYVATSMVSLAVRFYAGTSVIQMWTAIQPLALNGSLLIWLIALWSYCPNPSPDHTIHLEQDYEALVSRTKGLMGAIRAYIGKAERA